MRLGNRIRPFLLVPVGLSAGLRYRPLSREIPPNLARPASQNEFRSDLFNQFRDAVGQTGAVQFFQLRGCYLRVFCGLE